MKYLFGLILLLLVAAGGAYLVAGRMPPPTIAIDKPEKFVGTATPLEIKITAPEAPTMKPMQVVFEQNGKQTTLFSLDEPGKAQIRQEGPTPSASPTRSASSSSPICRAGRRRFRHRRPAGDARPPHPDRHRQQGRPGAAGAAAVSVMSTHHYVNHGGSRWSSIAPPRGRPVRRRRRRRVSRLPRQRRHRRRHPDQGPGRPRRVLRAAARPGPQHADARVRAIRRAIPPAPTSITAPSPSRSRRA